MVDNISYNQLYSTQQTYSSSSDTTSGSSFSDLFASSVASIGSVDSDEISLDLSSSTSTSMINSLMSILSGNSSSSSIYELLLSLIGLDSESSSGSSYAGLSSSLLQRISNGSSSTMSQYEGYSQAIPEAASVAANPFVTSSVYDRSASNYRSVIDQFNVETNPRYAVNKKGYNDTYCNIFVWDVTSAMGAEIPHYVDAVTQEPKYYPDTTGAREMNANSTYDWLANKGGEYGWKEVTAAEAQQLANEGHPVVTAKKNPSGHGHVQVVCPSASGTYNASTGVTVAQAGSTLSDYTTMSALYGTSTPSGFKYYAHV